MASAGKGLPLRPTLVSGVIGLILLAAGAVGISAYVSSRRVISGLWREFADEIAANTTQRTLRFLEPAVPTVALEKQLALEGKLDPNYRMATLEHFHAILLANPTFTWVSYGGADGAYLASYRPSPNQIQETLREQTREGTRWRDLVRQPDGSWTTVHDSIQPYDPRPRPWYVAATASDHGVWVEPFLFVSRQQPGFIYSSKDIGRDGIQRGVWAVQFEVEYLSEFLSTLHLGRTGRVYVVTRRGLVVGHPAGEVTEMVGGVKQIARAAEHEDPMLAGAWNELQRRGPGTRGFSFGPYLAMVADFPPESGIDWQVIGVVPKLDYFGDAERQAWTAVLIGALFALLASLFGAMLSTRVSAAMNDIAGEMDRIGRFEMSDRKLADEASIVREVNAMKAATDRMKSSLRSFGKYVPRELVQDLLLSGREARLGGEKIEITTLFSDIAGFTTLSESLAPDELVRELGEYFERMSETVREFHGTVDKYIGDAIMAFWNAPRPIAEHALLACRTALAMRDRLRAMQAEWQREGRAMMSARIGINTGVAVVGNIGSPNRMNYTAMGDAVNLASRLEGLNKAYGTGIIIGESTAALVKDRMVLRPIDWVAVKGKAQAVLVHELLGEKGLVEPAALRAIELHREALHLYRERNFSAAEMRFLEVFDTLGKSDTASRKLAERCKDYVQDPPPPEWNGSTAMMEK
jgi:adenylate cyclase